MTSQSTTIQNENPRDLVNRVLRGDQDALAQLFAVHHQRLWRMVNFRMNQRLRGRVDADDVLQEAFINASQRMEHFLSDASRSVFIWLRLIVSQTLVDVHRRHLMTQMRDANREFSIQSGWSSESTSFSLSFHLLGHLTSPSQAALRVELSQQLSAALSTVTAVDREVLALRHFEELSNSETAQVLNMSEQAASIRYIRALTRLKGVMSAIPGFLDEPTSAEAVHEAS